MSGIEGKYFTPLTYSYLNKKNKLLGFEKKVDKKTLLPLHFKNVPVSLVNGLKRIFISEIPNAGLDPVNIKIGHNTSQYNTEVLQDRLSMIYLNSNEIENYDLTNLIFFISDLDNPAQPLRNNTQSVIKIWAHNHLRIRSGQDETKLETKNLVPYNQLLFTLNPGEAVHAMMKASMGIGIQKCIWHASTAMHKFVTPQDSIENSQGPVETKAQEMAYLGHENKQPEGIILTIESVGKYDCNVIVKKGISVLKDKLELFKQQILLADKAPRLKIEADKNIPRLVKFTIQGEDDTLGHLLEEYGLIMLSQLIAQSLSTGPSAPVDPSNILKALLECRSDYRIPHPLEKSLTYTARTPTKFELKFPDGVYDEIEDPTIRFVLLTVDHIQNICDGLDNDTKSLF